MSAARTGWKCSSAAPKATTAFAAPPRILSAAGGGGGGKASVPASVRAAAPVAKKRVKEEVSSEPPPASRPRRSRAPAVSFIEEESQRLALQRFTPEPPPAPDEASRPRRSRAPAVSFIEEESQRLALQQFRLQAAAAVINDLESDKSTDDDVCVPKMTLPQHKKEKPSAASCVPKIPAALGSSKSHNLPAALAALPAALPSLHSNSASSDSSPSTSPSSRLRPSLPLPAKLPFVVATSSSSLRAAQRLERAAWDAVSEDIDVRDLPYALINTASVPALPPGFTQSALFDPVASCQYLYAKGVNVYLPSLRASSPRSRGSLDLFGPHRFKASVPTGGGVPPLHVGNRHLTSKSAAASVDLANASVNGWDSDRPAVLPMEECEHALRVAKAPCFDENGQYLPYRLKHTQQDR